MGESGSGKSASLRNFEFNEVGIFNVANKPLPFRKKLNKIDNSTYGTIHAGLNKASLKTYVIDDSQYLLAFHMFDKVYETGYGKFTEMAKSFYDLIKAVMQLPNDVIVYFLHHTEMNDFGKIKAKTNGKMLDNQLTLEGLFSIVLMAKINDQGQHVFITRSDGYTTCKSPMEMFDKFEIDNDLKFVDTKIREYYGINAANLKIIKGE